MQSLNTPVEALWVTRHFASVHYLQPGIAQGRSAAARGDQLDTLRREEPAELNKAVLVRHREQRAFNLHDVRLLHQIRETRTLTQPPLHHTPLLNTNAHRVAVQVLRLFRGLRPLASIPSMR